MSPIRRDLWPVVLVAICGALLNGACGDGIVEGDDADQKLPAQQSPLVLAASSVALAAQADAYVRSGSYASSNFGRDMVLRADQDENQTEIQSLIRVDVPAIGTISRARLRFFVTNPSSNSADIYQTSTAWDEYLVTWNNRPPRRGRALAAVERTVQSTFFEVDVTAAVQAGSAVAFAIVPPRSTDGFGIASRESAANQPVMIVDLVDLGGGATGGSVGSGGTGSAGGTGSSSDPCAAIAPDRRIYVSKHGTDGNAQSPATAVTTIAAAMTRLNAMSDASGAFVCIDGGQSGAPMVYAERMLIQKSGVTAPITITSFGQQATLDGTNISVGATSEQNQGLVQMSGANVTLSLIRLMNAQRTGIVLNSSGLTVANCRIEGSGRHAISTNTALQAKNARAMITNIVIRDNFITRNVMLGIGYGQAVSLIANGFVISGNTIWNNVAEGIDAWLGATNGRIFSNTVYDNGQTNIYVDGGSHLEIYNNRAYRSLNPIPLYPRGRTGILISSENNAGYLSHDIDVHDNTSDHHSGVGIGIWEPAYSTSHSVDSIRFLNNDSYSNGTNTSWSGMITNSTWNGTSINR